jgi:adenylate cyclase
MQPSAARLALLYRISQTFNSSLDLDEVLNLVMDEVIAAVHAERGFLMLRDEVGRMSFRAARGMDHRTIDTPEFQVSRGVVERVAEQGQPLLTSDAQHDAWLASRATVVGLGCAPFCAYRCGSKATPSA